MSSQKDKKENWPAIRDLFDQIITPAKSWQEATLIATPDEMADHFRKAFPGVMFIAEDLRLALYDLGVPYERNEHNNEYYYLAKWR